MDLFPDQLDPNQREIRNILARDWGERVDFIQEDADEKVVKIEFSQDISYQEMLFLQFAHFFWLD
ncbi:MAG: hypothetical protein KatS3mg093_457 [Candidatus Parcubacteria bacterium]|nr:MAG: hypothetical protein KatS3mg093_457 [Candidatus Parcubacteria bacterium]